MEAAFTKTTPSKSLTRIPCSMLFTYSKSMMGMFISNSLEYIKLFELNTYR
jgi:hypothetical protein